MTDWELTDKQFTAELNDRLDKGELQQFQKVIRTNAIARGLLKDDDVVVGGLQQVRPRMIIEPEILQKMPTLGGTPAEKEPRPTTAKNGKQ